MRFFLSYPIDQATGAPSQIHQIKSWLQERSDCSWVFDPGQAFWMGAAGGLGTDIRAINELALDRADVLVACLPAGAVSVGVPMEIDRAARAGKVVLVVSGAPSQMLQFGLPTAATYPAWGDEAREWLREALHGVSEGLDGLRRAFVPVVLDEGAEEPRRGYEDDAGLDLVVSKSVVVQPGRFVDIPCGVRVQLPDWSWGLITGRSSTLRKRGLMVNQGVIDTGFRGPLFAGVWNLTDKSVLVEKGERIAQLLVMVNGTRLVQTQRVSQLDAGSRGDAGFGSTGC